MNRFFAYEEYGAKYELMGHEVSGSYKLLPAWEAYERGMETLANSVSSIRTREAHSHKGLTFADLIVKVELSTQSPLPRQAFMLTATFPANSTHHEIPAPSLRPHLADALCRLSHHTRPPGEDRLSYARDESCNQLSDCLGHHCGTVSPDLAPTG